MDTFDPRFSYLANSLIHTARKRGKSMRMITKDLNEYFQRSYGTNQG